MPIIGSSARCARNTAVIKGAAMPSIDDLAEILIFIGLVQKKNKALALEKARIILKLCGNK
jgi:hypothetical protein